MIKVVIFDIGNVLFHISMENALRYWCIQTNTNYEYFTSKFEFDEAHKDFERGKISANEYRISIIKKTGVEISETLFFNGWNMIYLETFPQIIEVIENLKKNYKVVALSNTNTTHEQVWKWKYEKLINTLDFVYASHLIGHIKPDTSCFSYVINDLKVEPNEAIFFDDKLENIEGAKQFGLNAIQVISPKQMYNSMKKFGLKLDIELNKF